MPVDWEHLARLVGDYSLHATCDPREPVDVSCLLESCRVRYKRMPWPVLAMRTRIDVPMRGGRVVQVESVLYNTELRRIERSALHRYAQAHEWGHIYREHVDNLLWYALDACPLDKRGRNAQEREADQIAAFLLVRPLSLSDMAHCDRVYIARTLDVPERLVSIRFSMIEGLGV